MTLLFTRHIYANSPTNDDIFCTKDTKCDLTVVTLNFMLKYHILTFFEGYHRHRQNK